MNPIVRGKPRAVLQRKLIGRNSALTQRLLEGLDRPGEACFPTGLACGEVAILVRQGVIRVIEHPANLFVDARGLHGSDPGCALGGGASDPEINIDSLRAKLLRENFSDVRDRIRVELIRFGVGAPRVDRVGGELAFVARNLLFAPRGRARGIRKKRGGRVQFDMRNALRHEGIRRIFCQGFEARAAADLDGIGSLSQKKIALSLEVDIVVILSDRGR